MRWRRKEDSAVIDFRNKLAVVTGASSGIGAAFAKELARRGTHVALVARRQDRLAQVSRGIVAAGGEASVHACDVADRSAVEAACRKIVERRGSIDLLINNAGYGRHTLFKDHDVGDVER